MTKVDFKKTLDCYQAKRSELKIVNVPKMQYLMIDGHGDPNSSNEFKDAIVALQPVVDK